MSVPFTKKLAQVAIVVRDIEAARARYAALLGVEEPPILVTALGDEVNQKYRGAPCNARAKLAFFDLGGVQLELIEALDGPSAWSEGLEGKGERVHHLAFWTDTMSEAVPYLKEHGAPLMMRGDMGDGQYAYFDGTAPFGCFIELLEHKRTPISEE